MPLKYFIHPESGEKLEIEQCLKKGLLSEYYPLAYLNACAEQRIWEGKTSTTQLISGAREAYLKIFVDYAENPDKQIFRILGTGVHARLEDLTPSCSFSELHLPEQEINMTADLLEKQPNSEWWLIDHKVTGSFVIKRCLGLEKKRRPMKDAEGNFVRYKKNGKWGKAGDIRYEDFSVRNPNKADYGDWPIQLNRYRLEIEKYFNIKIPRLKVFAIPRDTDRMALAKYGIEGKPYYFDIPLIKDDIVDSYFKEKNNYLLGFIKGFESVKSNNKKEITEEQRQEWIIDNIPPACNSKESWDGRKCERFCPVSEVCKKVGCPWL